MSRVRPGRHGRARSLMSARRLERGVIVLAGLGIVVAALLGWREFALPPAPFEAPVGQGFHPQILFVFPIQRFSSAWFLYVLPPTACALLTLTALVAWLLRARMPRVASLVIVGSAVLGTVLLVVFGLAAATDDLVRPSNAYWLAIGSSGVLLGAFLLSGGRRRGRVSAAGLLACAVALGGCGDTSDGTSSKPQQRQVRRLLPDARDIRCASHGPQTTRCQAHVRKMPVGIEHWDCEFAAHATANATSGTAACFSEDGSARSLRPSSTAGKALTRWLRENPR